ncbi:hypothetical protein [Pseudofrankia inefficax]|uniref:hypothetical protein n=1 Tax=Pseudofrankia inefficax (strain DSM 45817 / CECT 9037 / DDB 130130 / EuI1c) TaxID=298654 RepID=UPI00031A0860|nr:hypothetical protein [Pseudofrankia inefficax]
MDKAPASPAAHASPPSETQPPATTWPPASSEPPPTPATTSPAGGCTPTTDKGHCYEPGEYCRKSDHGAHGVSGDGKAIVCANNDGWRWEPV